MEPPEYYYATEMEMEEETNESVEETDDIETDIKYLHLFDNEKQLKILFREIGHIVAHALIPPEGWYDERFEYIDMYSKLDWNSLATRFYNKDEYIYDTASYIMGLLEDLLDDRATKPTFNIKKYRELIYSIINVWNYYKKEYMENETDVDILNLIEGIKFL